MTCYKPVTIATNKALATSAAEADVVVAGFFTGFWAKISLEGAKNDVLQLAKWLLQLLQVLLFYSESKNSKGLQVVTRLAKLPKFVTFLLQTCYNLLQTLLQICYRVKYLKINTLQGL